MAELVPAEGLAAGLGAEYALIYVYGLAGANLDRDDAVKLAASAESSHRQLRDALTEYMTSTVQEVPAPQAGYPITDPVTNEDEAVALLVRLEDEAAGVWRTAIAETKGDDRRRAITGLVNAATQATLWRRWQGDVGVEAFPGVM